MEFNVGDVVETNRFGLMFIVQDDWGDMVWVSDSPSDVDRGRGNTILRSEVEELLLSVKDDNLEDWEDFFSDYGKFEDYDWEDYLDKLN